MTEVVPGIERLKITLPQADIFLGYVNAYLIQGEGGYTLIDTGWGTPEAFDSFKSQLDERGIGFKQISQIVATHIHPDHYGLSGKIKQLSGAKVMLHRLETSLVDNRYINMETLLKRLAEWLHVNGVPDETLPKLQTASLRAVEFVSPATPDVILSGGEIISAGAFNFKVLWTPGHTPGHICLYEPNRKLLFSGDHVLPTITPNIGRHPQSGDNPLGDYINSLKALKPLDVDLVLPGHEEPFRGLQKRIDEIIHHHEQRNSEILQTIKVEPKTGYEVATKITWLKDTTGGVGWQELSFWDKRLAVMETLSHLEAMRVDGRVNKATRDGIIYYHSVRSVAGVN